MIMLIGVSAKLLVNIMIRNNINVINWEINCGVKCITTSIIMVILISTDGYNMGQIENYEE